MYAFAGGAILTMLATSMMPEAYENGRPCRGHGDVVGGVIAFWHQLELRLTADPFAHRLGGRLVNRRSDGDQNHPP